MASFCPCVAQSDFSITCFYLEWEEPKNKWIDSEAHDGNSIERLCLQLALTTDCAGVSTSLLHFPSYARAAYSHCQCILNTEFFKYHCKASSKQNSKLSLTYAARDTDKYRDLEIHTERQRNMLSARNILWICKYLGVWYWSFAL